jgi:predicted HicB family RNase H-like nuclease
MGLTLFLPFTSFPFSGKILLHVSPGLHEALSLRAEAVGKSLNTIASEALRAGLVAT